MVREKKNMIYSNTLSNFELRHTWSIGSRTVNLLYFPDQNSIHFEYMNIKNDILTSEPQEIPNTFPSVESYINSFANHEIIKIEKEKVALSPIHQEWHLSDRNQRSLVLRLLHYQNTIYWQYELEDKKKCIKANKRTFFPNNHCTLLLHRLFNGEDINSKIDYLKLCEVERANINSYFEIHLLQPKNVELIENQNKVILAKVIQSWDIYTSGTWYSARSSNIRGLNQTVSKINLLCGENKLFWQITNPNYPTLNAFEPIRNHTVTFKEEREPIWYDAALFKRFLTTTNIDKQIGYFKQCEVEKVYRSYNRFTVHLSPPDIDDGYISTLSSKTYVTEKSWAITMVALGTGTELCSVIKIGKHAEIILEGIHNGIKDIEELSILKRGEPFNYLAHLTHEGVKTHLIRKVNCERKSPTYLLDAKQAIILLRNIKDDQASGIRVNIQRHCTSWAYNQLEKVGVALKWDDSYPFSWLKYPKGFTQ